VDKRQAVRFCYYISMSKSTTKIGNLGEQIAADFLEGKGYRVIDTNYRRSYGEIDIIAYKNNLLFVEVKSVNCRIPEDIPVEGKDTHRPEENVGKQKCRRLRRITETYLIHECTSQPSWRFDLICVYVDASRERARIKWLENIII